MFVLTYGRWKKGTTIWLPTYKIVFVVTREERRCVGTVVNRKVGLYMLQAYRKKRRGEMKKDKIAEEKKFKINNNNV